MLDGVSKTVASRSRKGSAEQRGRITRLHCSTVCSLGLPGTRKTLTCWNDPAEAYWGDSAFVSAVR